MQVSSAAGEFDFDVTGIESDGTDFVLVGMMGVWESRTRIAETDLVALVAIAFRSGVVWKLLLRIPALLFKAAFAEPSSPKPENQHE